MGNLCEGINSKNKDKNKQEGKTNEQEVEGIRKS
jgi:hypothetical protein